MGTWTRREWRYIDHIQAEELSLASYSAKILMAEGPDPEELYCCIYCFYKALIICGIDNIHPLRIK